MLGIGAICGICCGTLLVENCGLDEEMMLASTDEDMNDLGKSGTTGLDARILMSGVVVTNGAGC